VSEEIEIFLRMLVISKEGFGDEVRNPAVTSPISALIEGEIGPEVRKLPGKYH
jgi:hypothetical protein